MTPLPVSPALPPVMGVISAACVFCVLGPECKCKSYLLVLKTQLIYFLGDPAASATIAARAPPFVRKLVWLARTPKSVRNVLQNVHK